MSELERFYYDISVHPKCPKGLADPRKLKEYPILDFLNLVEYMGYADDLEVAMHEDATENANVQ